MPGFSPAPSSAIGPKNLELGFIGPDHALPIIDCPGQVAAGEYHALNLMLARQERLARFDPSFQAVTPQNSANHLRRYGEAELGIEFVGDPDSIGTRSAGGQPGDSSFTTLAQRPQATRAGAVFVATCLGHMLAGAHDG
jgi:hypothetical protein